MLRCERPHRPAAYEPILVRLPQVFGAALLHWEKKRQYFSVILVLKKTASLFLGIFFLQSASLCFFRPCREKVVSSRFLVPCSYKTKNFDDIKLSMALIQRFESDTDFFQSARKRTDVPWQGLWHFVFRFVRWLWTHSLQVASGNTVWSRADVALWKTTQASGLRADFGPVATSFWSSAFALGEKKAIFFRDLGAEKDCLTILRHFQHIVPFPRYDNSPCTETSAAARHVMAGTASIREDAPDAPLALSHPPWGSQADVPRLPGSKGSPWGPCHSSDTGSAMHFNRPLPEEGLKGGSGPCQACNLATEHEPATLSEIQCSAFVRCLRMTNEIVLSLWRKQAQRGISRGKLQVSWKGRGKGEDLKMGRVKGSTLCLTFGTVLGSFVTIYYD